MEKVVVATQKEMCLEEIKEKLEKMLERLEEDGVIIQPNSHVVIKPNLVSGRLPEEAATSHPAVIEAIVKICLERHCRITIAESPSGKMEESRMKMIYSRCGLWALKEKYPIELNISSDSVIKEVGLKISVPVLKNFDEADLIINCCKMKSHGYTLFTGAVKNCFGMIPGLKKAELHARFSKRSDFCAFIATLCEAMKPGLNIMDAIEAMHKDGPTNGKKIHVGRLLMATNPFALDEAVLNWVKMGRHKTPIQSSAIKLGYWNPNDLKVAALDEQANLPVVGFEFPKHLKNLISLLPIESSIKQLFAPYPKVDANRCVGCGECVKDCPAKTIILNQKKAEIHKEACLRCYCCQEVCPHNAIRLK